MSGHHHHGHGHGHSHGTDAGTGKAVGVTLIVNLLITAAKWFAFAVTRSPSLFGEAAHSTADSMNPLVLWFGARRSARPADERHPQGHGREAYFWSLIAAQLMLLVGAGLTAQHGIQTLIDGTVPHLSFWALAIMGMAAAGETYSLVITLKQLRTQSHAGEGGKAHEHKNPILLALVVENGADVLGVLLALAGYGLYVLTGNALWDALFSLGIATMLTCTSFFLINRNRSLIVGETAGPEAEQTVRQVVAEHAPFAVLERVTVTMVGANDTACHLEMRWNYERLSEQVRVDYTLHEAAFYAVRDSSQDVAALKAAIKKRLTNVSRVIIEIS